MTVSIGIDIGGTNFRIGVFNGLQLINESRFQANFSTIFKNNSPEVAWKTIVSTIADGISSVLDKHPEVKHIGIGFPGFIDPETQTISESPNLPGLKNANLAKDLSAQLKHFNITCIHVENDALAAAYGEYSVNEHNQSLLYFGLGTGVGGGLIICGAPYTGIHGMAMELGHLIIKPNGRPCGCGNRGCVEQYASATAVEISYFEASQQTLNAQEIAERAHNHDQAAINAYQLVGESLAIAAAHTIKVVDVPLIVIGGGLSQAWDLIEKSFHATLEKQLIPVLRGKITIATSTLNDNAGILGAARLALRSAHS